MSDWNSRATINERGIVFLVGRCVVDPSKFHVLRVNVNVRREGGVEGTVVAVDLTKDEADADAERLNRKAMT